MKILMIKMDSGVLTLRDQNGMLASGNQFDAVLADQLDSMRRAEAQRRANDAATKDLPGLLAAQPEMQEFPALT